MAFTIPADVPHDAAYRLGRLVLHQDFGGARKIIRTLFAARIVNDDAQIRFRRGAQPRFDHLPRREQVAEADDRKIMRQRRAEQGSARACGRNAGDDDNFRRVFPRDLVNRGGHAVNARVAGADHRGRSAGFCRLDGYAAALHLLHHRRRDIFLIRKIRPDKLHIFGIAADHLGTLQGAHRAHRQHIVAPGADSDNI